MSTKSREELERFIEAIEDEPITKEEGDDAVRRLGIDVKALAAAIRSRVDAADRAAQKARVDAARAGYRADAERLARRPIETSDDQDAVLAALISRVPKDQQLGLNFHKYERATKEERAELIRSLRHLLGDDADDGE